MASNSDDPKAPFQRSLSLCTKTISGSDELTLSFGGDTVSVNGDVLRLPQMARELTLNDIMVARGQADAAALRIANHDKATHNHYMPEGKLARAVYEAAEQARVESIGAKTMSGLARNLSAMIENKFEQKNVNPAEGREGVPLEDVISLVVRERLTGEQPPENATEMVELWKPWIEEKARTSLISFQMQLMTNQLLQKCREMSLLLSTWLMSLVKILIVRPTIRKKMRTGMTRPTRAAGV